MKAVKLKLVIVMIAVCLSSACASATPIQTTIPTPDARATETQIAANIYATQTASVPTATHTLTHTATPFPTSTPTNTPTPSLTPTLTATSTPRPLPISTPTPEFIFQTKNAFYECNRGTWQYRDGNTFVGPRYFQITLAIKNVSADKTLAPVWNPSRWIITDGTNKRVDQRFWQYIDPNVGRVLIPQPFLSPGVSSEWTFMAFPLQQPEWVDHYEWDLFGRTYFSERFSPGEFGNAFNFRSCS